MASNHSQTLRDLLDAAVTRLVDRRTTFTEAEAFQDIWDAGYDLSPQSDKRFSLAREADGRNPRQWRLADQVLVNNRLLESLESGTWDGCNLDDELTRLSARDGVHYVYCPADPRFERRPDGVLEPAEREQKVLLVPEVRAELDLLLPALLERSRQEGGLPRTVRQLSELLGALGWTRSAERRAWLLVRAWLLQQQTLCRVGQDYWVPADGVPSGPARTRLNVIPVFTPNESPSDGSPQGKAEREVAPARQSLADQIPLPEGGVVEARWTVTLRTVHLVEGFLSVPADARQAYPPRARQAGEWEVLSGRWFETGDRLWVWLDRGRDLLCGPDLADRLQWLEAGERLGILWAAEGLVFRSLGVDEEVQREETRLVDRDALAELRGELGESYRRSLVAILRAAPEGLTFRDLVTALRERQKHVIHQGTIRAVLYAGEFVCRERRWFVLEEGANAGRRWRRTVTRTLIPNWPSDPNGSSESLGELAKAIMSRLQELIAEWNGYR
jgi:hypothetical protein